MIFNQLYLCQTTGKLVTLPCLVTGSWTESDISVFDGDKYMTELVKAFPETISDALWSPINDHLFQEEKHRAIRSGLNYAFGTDLSKTDPMISVHEFQNAGYEIHLIFMGLNSLEESIQRVVFRVRAAGNKVPEDSIRYNYEYSFKNLYKYFKDLIGSHCLTILLLIKMKLLFQRKFCIL